MLRFLMALMVALVLVPATAEARIFGRWRRSRRVVRRPVYIPVNYGNAVTDQDRCQVEANYMAAHNLAPSQHVGVTIGLFEGVGCWGNTCVPNRPMVLTGEAWATSASGVQYTVRSWR